MGSYLIQFFCGSLVIVSWQGFISSLVMKMDFIRQPSSKSTLPFAGLQHMKQCQVNFNSIFAFMLWSKWMVHEKWSPQPLSHESFDFTLIQLSNEKVNMKQNQLGGPDDLLRSFWRFLSSWAARYFGLQRIRNASGPNFRSGWSSPARPRTRPTRSPRTSWRSWKQNVLQKA